MRIFIILSLIISFNLNADTYSQEVESEELRDLNNCIADNLADYEIRCFTDKDNDEGDELPEEGVTDAMVKAPDARAKYLCVARGMRRRRVSYYYGYSRTLRVARRAAFRKCRRYRNRRCRIIRCWYVR